MTTYVRHPVGVACHPTAAAAGLAHPENNHQGFLLQRAGSPSHVAELTAYFPEFAIILI